MTIYSLKPFEDKGYLSEEEALKQIEGIPIPGDKPGDAKPVHVKPKEKLPQDNPAVDLEGILIDLNSLTNEKGNIIVIGQEGFIEKFNELNRIMVSMPDLYLAGKSGNAALLASLQEDFKASWIISSTRIKYSTANLEGEITHYFGLNATPPIPESAIVIPDYSTGVYLKDVLATSDGLLYLQKLFRTQDDAKEIKRTLKGLSNYDFDKTRIWTPDQESRKQIPERAAGLDCDVGGFLVCGGSLDGGGRSRGVRIGAAGASQKNRGRK